MNGSTQRLALCTRRLRVSDNCRKRTPPSRANHLREHVHLIRGNHDDSWSRARARGFSKPSRTISKSPLASARGHKLVLFHYPIMSWNGKRRDAIALHGHVHSKGAINNERNASAAFLRYDVGVDANSYAPVSLAEILKILRGRSVALSNGVRRNRENVRRHKHHRRPRSMKPIAHIRTDLPRSLAFHATAFWRHICKDASFSSPSSR